MQHDSIANNTIRNACCHGNVLWRGKIPLHSSTGKAYKIGQTLKCNARNSVFHSKIDETFFKNARLVFNFYIFSRL